MSGGNSWGVKPENEDDRKPWEYEVTEEEFRAGNARLVEEFRENGGKVGGDYEGSDLLLLTTTGRKSGKPHTVPLGCLVDGERLIISCMPEATYPDWLQNLRANSAVTVEFGTDTFETTATVTAGEERERLWVWVTERLPWLIDHQPKTPLQIPLITLQR